MPDPTALEAKRALLEKYLRRDLPQTPTAPSTVPQHVEAEVVKQDERLLTIQTGVTKRPFFFLHGDWTGKGFFCFSIAHDLGPDQPFYALEPYMYDGMPVLPTLETMAAADIKIMRSIQPEGPYLLGGFCNGGLVAYEMARELHAQGQKVDLLVLVDAIPARVKLIHAVITRLGNLLRLGQDKQLEWFLRLQHMYRYLRDKNADDFEYLRTIDPSIDAVFPPVEALRKEYPAMFTWATAGYVPSFYPGRVTLFWDSAEPVRRRWWHSMARNKDKEVEVHIIPGTHTTCKTEHVHGFAEHLRACLNKVQLTALSKRT